ncbi:hypothetical protein ACHAL6_15425 [Proteiniclasticum sp. C24MP]|uniref:hypothetical protein n=1 Tax=Proteiniclasticum sp. C24MP TaxID=3374101 RepID=UPI0037545403
MKKLLTTLLAVSILSITLSGPKVTQASIITEEPFIVETNGDYVTICVENSEDAMITADVKKDQVDSFISDYVDGKIQVPRANIGIPLKDTNQLITPMAFIPPSNAKLHSEQRLYRSDIKAIVVKLEGLQKWTSLPNPLTEYALNTLLAGMGFANPVSLLVTVPAFVGVTIINTDYAWWSKSYRLLVDGDIRYVRQAVYYNTGTGYPAAWRICERIY